MENTDLPVVQVIPRTRYAVRGGDETLKRRVAAKFADGDVSGAVRELASADGLAPQDGDKLRALKEKHPSAPENLSLPDPPDGSVVPQSPRKKMFEKESCLFMLELLVGQMTSALATFVRWGPMVQRKQDHAFYPL